MRSGRLSHLFLASLSTSLLLFGGTAFGQYYSGKATDSSDDETVSELTGTVTLDTVTVTADRPEYEKILSPGTVSWIEPEKMEGEQKDLPSLLERVPGVMIRRQGTGQYSYATIRGSTGSQVSVYVDGVPQNTGGSQTVDLSLIPVHNVARIEVYRGYVPNRFSGAPMGGVINIVTKKPEGLGGKAEVGMRSFGGYNGNLSLTAPLLNGSLLVAAGYDESEGDFKYYHPPAPVNPALNNPGGYRWRRSNSYNSTDLLMKWQNDNWLIRGSWKETDRYFPAPTAEFWADLYNPSYPPHGIASQYAVRWQKVIQKDVSVGWNDTFWDRLTVSMRFDYMDNDRNYENRSPRAQAAANIFPGELWADYRTQRWSPVVDVSLKITDWNLLEFHGDYSDETFDVAGSHWLEHNSARSWELKPGYEQKTWHLQLQDTVTLDQNDSFWLTLIGRAQKVEGSDRGGNGEDLSWSDDQWKYSWGAALKKEFKSIGLTAQTTYGTYYRYPSFYEIYGDGVFVRPGAGYSNANYHGLDRPSWEHGKQWDIGLSWRGDFLGASHYLAATYFKREMDDLISFVNTPRYWVIYQNVGKGEAEGVEFEANMSWPLFTLYLSATYLDAEITKADSRFRGFIGSQAGPMINQPEWEYFVRGDLTLPWFDEKVKFFAEYKYLDKIPFNIYAEYNTYGDSRIIYEDELALTNLGVKWQATEGLDFTFGVNDVFNKGPEQGYVAYVGNRKISVTRDVGKANLVDYPQQGRTWYATAKYKF